MQVLTRIAYLLAAIVSRVRLKYAQLVLPTEEFTVENNVDGGNMREDVNLEAEEQRVFVGRNYVASELEVPLADLTHGETEPRQE